MLSEKTIRKNIKTGIKFTIRNLLEEKSLGKIQFEINSIISDQKYNEMMALLPKMPPNYCPVILRYPIIPSESNNIIRVKIDPYLYKEVKEDILLTLTEKIINGK